MLSTSLQSKWSCCSVNTGLICRGARLGYINLNLAAVPQRSATARRMEERRKWGKWGDSQDGWTQRGRAMIQSVEEIYQSTASLPSFSESNSFIKRPRAPNLAFFFLPGAEQVGKKMGLFKLRGEEWALKQISVADWWPDGICRKWKIHYIMLCSKKCFHLQK